jgi:hypothetical protein
MPDMGLHLLAVLVMVAHVALNGTGARPGLAPLCGEIVMVIAMLDMVLGAVVLSPVAWLAVTVITAVGIAAVQGPRSHARGADVTRARFAGSWVHGAFALILIGLVQLVTAPHQVATTGAHHSAAVELAPFVLSGLVAHATVSAVTVARSRGMVERLRHLLAGTATALMALGLLVG